MSKSPDNKPRVTQKDIAQVAGVSRVTVTYALKDNPRLPLETRERIQQIARDMGYMRDPLFATLARYRSRDAASCHGVIAWLVWESESNSASSWRQSPHYVDYFEGATKRAPQHGYKVEEFRFDAAKISPKRVGGILRSRGISSILLCPPSASSANISGFPWKHFSCISFGYALRDPALHSVASAHFQNVRAAIRKLRERGRQRIGLIISRTTDIRCNRFVSAAFLVEQQSLPCKAHTPAIPLIYHDYEVSLCAEDGEAYLDEIVDYAKTHQLDAVLTSEWQLDVQAGLPEGVDIVGLSLPAPTVNMSGIVEDSQRIGAVAVDQLVAMVQRGERDIPQTPLRTHIEGIWHDKSNASAVPPATQNTVKKVIGQ